MKTFHEPAREVRVVDESDVLVCGRGPAGVAAAVAAARGGARTGLIEVNGCLGGIWTAGLMCHIIDGDNKGGMMREMFVALRERGAKGTHHLRDDLFTLMSNHEYGRTAYDADHVAEATLHALIAKDVDGLMMAGRCISGDFLAHASDRVTGNAVAMGEAAGLTAAKAALSDRLPQDVPWADIGAELTRLRQR